MELIGVKTQKGTDMKNLEYKISFNTPAFLGNVDQQGQWLTPPLRAASTPNEKVIP